MSIKYFQHPLQEKAREDIALSREEDKVKDQCFRIFMTDVYEKQWGLCFSSDKDQPNLFSLSDMCHAFGSGWTDALFEKGRKEKEGKRDEDM